MWTFLNREISEYISTNMAHESNTRGSRILSAYFKVTSNVERISDHAMNNLWIFRVAERKDVSGFHRKYGKKSCRCSRPAKNF